MDPIAGILSRTVATKGKERSVFRRYAPVIGAVLVSRLVIIAAGLLVEGGAVPLNPALGYGDPAPILRSLTSWDGSWFIGIARDGYHLAAVGPAGYHDYAFFPLYPMLVRVLALPWPDLVGAIAVGLNFLLFPILLALLVRLGRRHIGERRAIRAAALYALFPFSYVFSMAYSETLTLTLILAAFLLIERGHVVRAGALYGLASLARAQSAFYFLPLLFASRLAKPGRWRLLAIGLGPLGTLSYLVWVAWFTGSPNGYFATYAAWGRNTGGAAAGLGSVSDEFSGPLAWYFAILMVCLVFAVALFVFVRVDRIPPAYVAIPVISLVMLFVTGSLEAIGRIVLLAFPYSWILASRQHPVWRYGWPALSVLLLAFFSTLTFAGWWNP